MFDIPDGCKATKVYDALVCLKNQKLADELFDSVVLKNMQILGVDRDQAEKNVRENIGYYAAYWDTETRERCEKLYGAIHPFLGPVSNNYTPEEIFELGKQWGEKIRNAGATS